MVDGKHPEGGFPVVVASRRKVMWPRDAATTFTVRAVDVGDRRWMMEDF